METATDTDDADVVRRSRSDPECFATLFDRYFTPLHMYASRRLGGSAGDDVASETFLIAFDGRDRFDPGRGSVRAWLYGIATNLIRGHRRAEERGYRAYARAAAEPFHSGDEERADARIVAGAARDMLVAALADLSSGDRDALLLVVWGELSHEETAQALDIPVGTVGSRLHRARRRLRAALDVVPARGTATARLVTGSGGRRTVTVTPPAGAAFVSLRATAATDRGITVEQTIIRAYGLR